MNSSAGKPRWFDPSMSEDDYAESDWHLAFRKNGRFVTRVGLHLGIDTDAPAKVVREAVLKLGYEIAQQGSGLIAFPCRDGWNPWHDEEIGFDHQDVGRAQRELLERAGIWIKADD